MNLDLAHSHPHFSGNWEELRQFPQLASSPLRSQAREDALRAWERYKFERQLEPIGRSRIGMRAEARRGHEVGGVFGARDRRPKHAFELLAGKPPARYSAR
jgi:hypothetical protein